MEKIDFVVPWVDSNDPEWIKIYNHYRPETPIVNNARFRNWNLFRYWFRAVERYAPWVNKVFLIMAKDILYSSFIKLFYINLSFIKKAL